MKVFFDTEFIETPGSIELISIGMVRDDGESLYLQNAQCDFARAGDWITRNVLMQLTAFDMGTRWPVLKYPSTAYVVDPRDRPWASRRQILDAVSDFAPPEDKPEFWGYYADYDWVVFCWLFGSMVQLPKGYPKYCRDIKQLCDHLGNPQLPEKGKREHDALSDAFWNKRAYEFLARQALLRS